MKIGWEKSMYVSESGLALIMHFEGFRSAAYKCPSGVWTIGYGHTDGVKEGDRISQESAKQLLESDLKKNYGQFLNTALRERDIYAEQCEFDALLSFAYNCGCGALSLMLFRAYDRVTEYGELSNFERLIDDEIAEIMMRYVYSNGTPLSGLKRRRAREIDILKNGWGNELECIRPRTFCKILTGAKILTSPNGFEKEEATKNAISYGVEPLGVTAAGWAAVRCQNDMKGWIETDYIDANDCVVIL